MPVCITCVWSIVQNAVCTCCSYVGKCEKGLVWSDRREKVTYVNPRIRGDTNKEAQVWKVRWSLSRSSLTVRCVGVSAFHFPIIGVLSLLAITTMHCTVHMSMAWRHRVVAWACATYQYHVNGTDTVGQLVGRSVDAHGPVDHDSVGHAQAHPNNNVAFVDPLVLDKTYNRRLMRKWWHQETTWGWRNTESLTWTCYLCIVHFIVSISWVFWQYILSKTFTNKE